MRTALFALLLAACSHDTPSPPPPPSQTKTLEPAENLGSLAARLSYEAAHRPAAGPSADHVLDAIEATGMKLDGRRQFLGLAMKASYCAGGTTKDGVAISVCEYPSAAAATKGKAFADTQYAAIEATRAAHGAAVLTIAGTRDVDRALTAFQATN